VRRGRRAVAGGQRNRTRNRGESPRRTLIYASRERFMKRSSRCSQRCMAERKAERELALLLLPIDESERERERERERGTGEGEAKPRCYILRCKFNRCRPRRKRAKKHPRCLVRPMARTVRVLGMIDTRRSKLEEAEVPFRKCICDARIHNGEKCRESAQRKSRRTAGEFKRAEELGAASAKGRFGPSFGPSSADFAFARNSG